MGRRDRGERGGGGSQGGGGGGSQGGTCLERTYITALVPWGTAKHFFLGIQMFQYK